jgi:tRNA-2-methylthio-N6-dimethylallyladenosine synthase
MNAVDTGKMLAMLSLDGYRPCDRLADADVILLNTCSVREKPEQKLLSFLGRVAGSGTGRPRLVAVAGCFAQHDGARLFAEHPEIDLVFGPDALPRVRELFKEGWRRRVLDTRFSNVHDTRFVDALPVTDSPLVAMLTIQKGCDNHCTYCVVPAARGPEHSRPSAEILEEARALVARGARDLTLLGQNVDSYGRKLHLELSFAELLHAVAAIPGLLRLRFMTSHPRDLSSDVIDAFRSLPRLASHLHLPVQSGSDRVLRRMNRAYSRARYLDLVAALRAARPDISLTTDFIVGFPGEDDADFEQTLALLEEIRFDASFSFRYSPRPRTPARVLHVRDPVPEGVARARLEKLQAVQGRITRENLEALRGRVFDVLVEGASRQEARILCGRTSCFRTLNFEGSPELTGSVQRVRVEEAHANSLRGRLENPEV